MRSSFIVPTLALFCDQRFAGAGTIQFASEHIGDAARRVDLEFGIKDYGGSRSR